MTYLYFSYVYLLPLDVVFTHRDSLYFICAVTVTRVIPLIPRTASCIANETLPYPDTAMRDLRCVREKVKGWYLN